ncbi:MAG: ABC transporter permease [Idiomarina sp.]|nr:ABC transporter permease [Idiomarina sp.]
MSRVILRQLSLLIITLILLSVLSFSLTYGFPGDPVTNSSGISAEHPTYEQVRETRGFDRSIPVQYVRYVQHLARGDWGVSLQDAQPVWEEFRLRFPATLELTFLSMGLALLLGPPLGIIAAMNYKRPIDHAITALSLSGYSIPVFWFAQLSILIFAVVLEWFPIAGQINPLLDVPPVTGAILIDLFYADASIRGVAFQSAIQHLILPVLVLALVPLVLLIRLTRNAMIDVNRKKFMKGAYARGLSTTEVMMTHGIPNAMQPVTRQIGTAFSILMTNTLITEVIFSWPGLGNWLVRSIYERDYPVIQGGLVLLATLILLFNIFISLIHAWRYPQVRQEIYAQS